MKLSGYLEKNLTATGLSPTDKAGLFDHLLAMVEKHYPLGNRKKVLDDLLVRERQSTTGIGCGVAIPHTIVESLPKTVLAIASIPEGMEFHAVDHMPVNVVFMLLSPPNRVREHIKLLARIARICSTPQTVKNMGEAQGGDAILAIIKREDQNHVG
jgi:mannitol/fructose-specific phosphotransferase system IIA component (Ntr-type)